MYPLLLDGMIGLGGESKAPQHLQSFCGNFVNMVFAIASQFAGAVATVEFLNYLDYFARKDFGEDYLENENALKILIENIQHVVYSINQPAAARGYQSVFWNISIYDKEYFEAMFGNFVFPDNSKPNWDTVNGLQKLFMKWFNAERSKSILTYPVVTAACLTSEGKLKDHEFEDFISQELSEGNSFFVFMNDNPHALSSCCRLKNNIEDQINEFSYTLGAGGVSTGSLNVITLNMNRLFQDKRNIREEISKIHKYQIAYRKITEEYLEAGLLSVYNAGFISIDKQYLTIGINGLVEAAEYLNMNIGNNKDYIDFVSSTLKEISDENKIASKKYGYKFNTEFVPAENLGVKFAKWDKNDNYVVNRDCYNSYIYLVEDEEISPIDKIILHGRKTSEFLDGGSALHLNLDQYPNKEAFRKLLNVCAVEGCEYFCFNIKITICRDCKNIDKRTRYSCDKCGSKEVDHATRVIGYLKNIASFSEGRKIEASKRFYNKDA